MEGTGWIEIGDRGVCSSCNSTVVTEDEVEIPVLITIWFSATVTEEDKHERH